MGLGKRLAIVFEEKGVKNNDVAEKLNLSPEHVSRFLNEKVDISLKLFYKINSWLLQEYNMNWLFNGVGPKKITTDSVNEPPVVYGDDFKETIDSLEQNIVKLKRYLPQ